MLAKLHFPILLFLLCTCAFSQGHNKGGNAYLIDSSQPPVYIEFVRTGKCTKDSLNFNFGDLCNAKGKGTFEAAWLRLVNNTRWSVGLTVDKAATEKNASPVVIDSTTFIDDDGERAAYAKMVANNGSEMDVVYKSEVETGCDFGKRAPKGQSCFKIQATAPPIPLPAISSDVFVAAGQSVVFPIDLAHVKEYVNLYVLYNFSWEYSGKSFSRLPHYDSQHRAYFGWFDLAKGIKAEREKKIIG